MRTHHTCLADTSASGIGIPVRSSGFHLIGKETERGWEQAEDISTLLPSLMRYQKSCVVGEQVKQRLLHIPLDVLELPRGQRKALSLWAATSFRQQVSLQVQVNPEVDPEVV